MAFRVGVVGLNDVINVIAGNFRRGRRLPQLAGKKPGLTKWGASAHFSTFVYPGVHSAFSVSLHKCRREGRRLQVSVFTVPFRRGQINTLFVRVLKQGSEITDQKIAAKAVSGRRSQ